MSLLRNHRDTTKDPLPDLDEYHYRCYYRKVPWIGINNYGRCHKDDQNPHARPNIPAWKTDLGAGMIDKNGFEIPIAPHVEQYGVIDPVDKALAILEGRILASDYENPEIELPHPAPLTVDNAEIVDDEGRIRDGDERLMGYWGFRHKIQDKFYQPPRTPPPEVERKAQNQETSTLNSAKTQRLWKMPNFLKRSTSNLSGGSDASVFATSWEKLKQLSDRLKQKFASREHSSINF